MGHPSLHDTRSDLRKVHHPRPAYPAYHTEQRLLGNAGPDQIAETETTSDTAHYSSRQIAQMDSRKWLKTEIDEPYHTSGYLSRIQEHPLPSFSYHSDIAKEEPYYPSTSQDPLDHTGRPFMGHDSTASNAYYRTESSHPPQSDRISLQAPLRHGRFSLPAVSRDRPYASRQQGSSSASTNRNGHVAVWADAGIPRDTNASKYFPGHRTPGVTRPARFENVVKERDVSDHVAEEEWSTLPAKRTPHNRHSTTGIATKPFRLPGKLFGAPQGAQSTQPSRLADRSSDSATEVVVPLRRTKLTLFEPSPPKPYH